MTVSSSLFRPTLSKVRVSLSPVCNLAVIFASGFLITFGWEQRMNRVQVRNIMSLSRYLVNSERRGSSSSLPVPLDLGYLGNPVDTNGQVAYCV